MKKRSALFFDVMQGHRTYIILNKYNEVTGMWQVIKGGKNV